MSKTLGALGSYFLSAGLGFYGLSYHISSSEFWPITISKTWFSAQQFEPSMLQKPLFSLFLSLFHLIPLSDLQHLYIVKAVFAVLGVTCLVLTVKIACVLSNIKYSNSIKIILILFLLAISPTLLNNFFRVRSDQFSLLFFLSSVYFLLIYDYKKSIFAAVLTLLTAVKSLIFLPFLLLLLALNLNKSNFFKKLTKFQLTIAALATSACLIWLINFNIPALHYLLDTLEQTQYPTPWFLHFVKLEILSLIFLIISFFYIYKKSPSSILISTMSLLAFVLITIMPQNFPFLIASLVPIIYMPLLVMVLDLYEKRRLLQLAVFSVLLVLNLTNNPEAVLFSPNSQQIKYISYVSPFLEQNKMYYLDGVGIFPRQNLVKCFTSPNDASSNFACKNKIERAIPDAIIHTGRLASEFGLDMSALISQSYSQDVPFIYIRKLGNYTGVENLKPLLSNGQIIPLLLFQFN